VEGFQASMQTIRDDSREKKSHREAEDNESPVGATGYVHNANDKFVDSHGKVVHTIYVVPCNSSVVSRTFDLFRNTLLASCLLPLLRTLPIAQKMITPAAPTIVCWVIQCITIRL